MLHVPHSRAAPKDVGTLKDVLKALNNGCKARLGAGMGFDNFGMLSSIL